MTTQIMVKINESLGQQKLFSGGFINKKHKEKWTTEVPYFPYIYIYILLNDI